jgi:transposase
VSARTQLVNKVRGAVKSFGLIACPRARSHKQERLRSDLVEFLDDNGLVPFEKQEAVADEIAELAKALHTRLCPS